jgi:hypothetical protein
MIKYLKFDRWHLLNTDTGEVYHGQYPAEDLTRSFGSVWTEKIALNRKKAILQFLHGMSETVSFTAVFFAEHDLKPVDGDLKILERMATRDSILGRPPLLEFWVGDGHVSMPCVIDGAISLRYERPQVDGAARMATAQIVLREHTPFKLDEVSNFETRYHRTKDGDYPELLAAIEYKLPMLGVELERRQPSITLTHEINTVIKLPSIEGMRKASIAPTSIVFRTVTSKSKTPQRQLLASMARALAVPKFSTVIT